jgi:hypothetical protein
MIKVTEMDARPAVVTGNVHFLTDDRVVSGF